MPRAYWFNESCFEIFLPGKESWDNGISAYLQMFGSDWLGTFQAWLFVG